MKLPATPTAALAAQIGTKGSTATFEPGARGKRSHAIAEAGPIREHVAGFEQNLRLDGRQIVWQRQRSAAERAAVIGGHHGLQHRRWRRDLLFCRYPRPLARSSSGTDPQAAETARCRPSSRRTRCRSRPGRAGSAPRSRRVIQRVSRHRSGSDLVQRSAPARRTPWWEVCCRGGQAEAAQPARLLGLDECHRPLRHDAVTRGPGCREAVRRQQLHRLRAMCQLDWLHPFMCGSRSP